MKAEHQAVAKVRPRQSFDAETSCADRSTNGLSHGGFPPEATHIGSVILPGRVIYRVGLCDEHAGAWDMAGRVR